MARLGQFHSTPNFNRFIQSIEKEFAMPAMWAYSKNVPGRTCPDAHLLGGGTNLQYPAGNRQGQAGWDIGLMFNDIYDLLAKIQELHLTEKITRLAINVHGSP